MGLAVEVRERLRVAWVNPNDPTQASTGLLGQPAVCRQALVLCFEPLQLLLDAYGAQFWPPAFAQCYQAQGGVDLRLLIDLGTGFQGTQTKDREESKRRNSGGSAPVD